MMTMKTKDWTKILKKKKKFRSSWEIVQHGVPQGSVLGPSLFNMFINDYPLQITSLAEVIMSADDTSIFVSHTNDDDFMEVLTLYCYRSRSGSRLLSHPHAVDYVPAPVWNWDSPLTRTPHFCRAHCDRWHIRHWIEPLSRIRHLRMCPAEYGMIHSADPCRHPTVHSRKLGDTASHSSLSSCGLALLTVAHQALTIVFLVDFIGERSMEAATAAHVSKRVVFLPLRGLSLTHWGRGHLNCLNARSRGF